MHFMPHESGLEMAKGKSGTDDVDEIFVTSIELIDFPEPVEVFDIQVAVDESFIVAGVVVHNSAVCRARDGKVYPIDSGPRPPAHPNCRSTTVPVLKSWKEMGINLKEAPEGTRAALDGQEASSVTYEDWLRRQSKDFQEEVLGLKKARLFRDGNLKLDRFVDKKGAELTLDQLRTKEASAFSRAGL